MGEAGMNNQLHTWATKEELHTQLAERIAEILQQTIAQEGAAFMAVSGGSTPKPLFAKLSTYELEWEKVTVTLVDERWVDPEHQESNEKLVKEHLMQNRAASAQFIPLKNSAKDPFAGVALCNEQFQALPKPLDVVILGMGTDGHTASFFPDDTHLHHALTTGDFCAATIPTDAPHQRITLSLQRLLHAKYCFLHIEGEAKKAVFDHALQEGAVELMPIRAFLHNDKPLEVYYAQ
jgi:6-phosphogluconolactonase